MLVTVTEGEIDRIYEKEIGGCKKRVNGNKRERVFRTRHGIRVKLREEHI